MRVVIQRVSQASVTVENEIISEIKTGLLVLLGVGEGDTKERFFLYHSLRYMQVVKKAIAPIS